MGGYKVFGPNIKLDFWTWQKVEGIYRRVKNLTVTRPLHDFINTRIMRSRAELQSCMVYLGLEA